MDKQFGYRLRSLRVDKGLTGTQLGESINVDKATIANWETGRYYPNNERLIALADALNVSVDYLMGRTTCKKPISILTSDEDKKIDLRDFSFEQQELLKSIVKQFNK